MSAQIQYRAGIPPESYQVFSDSYRALKQTAAIGAVAPRTAIGISGKDRAAYLQGLLTNDVQALEAGSGCYSAWLTPQGRMLTDLHIFESGDMILLDVPAELGPATLQRLDQFLFSEDVQFADLSEALRSVWLHGPQAAAILERVIGGSEGPALRDPASFESWPEYHNARAQFSGSPVVVARVSQLGVPGFCVYIEPSRVDDLTRALQAGGATLADPAAIETARIESGYPIFGVDMTEDTIPLEAGIEDRAISLSKGCYVGQEVIIRVLHRGQGRVARRLVALRIDGDPPSRGTKIWSAEREVGFVTSAASSPRFGTVALGYVHRDFVGPGTRIEIDSTTGRASAVVTERPIPVEA
jgi:folate-binding protein YgfZ